MATENQGWVKAHRKLLENPRFRDGDWLKVWVWMLLNASHKPHDVMFRGERITLKAGQFTAGRFQISEQTGVNASKVKRVIEALKSDQQIDQQISNACSLFTITKWNEYQESDQPNGQPVTSQRPASDQPVTTKQEWKNDKNGKKEEGAVVQEGPLKEMPAHLKTQRMMNKWGQWMNFRRGYKKPKNWAELFNEQIDWLTPFDEPTAFEILSASIRNGWQGLFAPKQPAKPQPAVHHQSEGIIPKLL